MSTRTIRKLPSAATFSSILQRKGTAAARRTEGRGREGKSFFDRSESLAPSKRTCVNATPGRRRRLSRGRTSCQSLRADGKREGISVGKRRTFWDIICLQALQKGEGRGREGGRHPLDSCRPLLLPMCFFKPCFFAALFPPSPPAVFKIQDYQIKTSGLLGRRRRRLRALEGKGKEGKYVHCYCRGRRKEIAHGWPHYIFPFSSLFSSEPGAVKSEEIRFPSSPADMTQHSKRGGGGGGFLKEG